MPSDLLTRAPFSTLFPVDERVRDAIAGNMRDDGYDPAHPIIAWRENGNRVVIDGHTRLAAAKLAGVEPVVVDRDFTDEDEALEAAIREQRDRRNLDGKELTRYIVAAVEALDQRQESGARNDLASGGARSKSADRTADMVGTSPRTVERIRTVLDDGDDWTKEQLRAGEIKPRTAYRATLEYRDHHARDSIPHIVRPHLPPPKPTFNTVNDNIGWAKWSWNPVTGCLHNCPYCYARDIATRFYTQGFKPTFLPERLPAPTHTRLPAGVNSEADPSWRRVFTCSMADLFGKWVPQEWIDAVFTAIVDAPQWEFLCLTKFPQRLAELEWPANAWVGTTVDRQHRVQVAQRHFADVKAGVKWLSCEPLLEPLKFDSLEMFDWVVIGACTKSSGAPEFAPPFDWVADLYEQARASGCKVYLKSNLFGMGEHGAPGMAAIREWPR